MIRIFFFATLVAMMCKCASLPTKELKKTFIATEDHFQDHTGFMLYDPERRKTIFEFNATKYFTPGSNTKIFTFFSSLKILGDSIPALKYVVHADSLIFQGMGDPSFLYKNVFNNFKTYDFLSHTSHQLYYSPVNFQTTHFGAGWAWDDYNDDYMAERSALPVYGNTAAFTYNNRLSVIPAYFTDSIIKSVQVEDKPLTIRRLINNNSFAVTGTAKQPFTRYIPFITNGSTTAVSLLKDTAGIKSFVIQQDKNPSSAPNDVITIHSQPTDSLLKIMMHRSDNFYAEQSLLMVSNEMLGTMNDEKIIDTLLNKDFKNIPQKPQWVDGSGLSRYNLFTPQDFVFVLNKMRNEFSWNRITTIFPTGGAGTLGRAYSSLEGKIYAKTGTLSNNASLSGYLITNKGKTFIFSVMVGNHMTSVSAIRDMVSKFLSAVADRY